MLSIALFLYAAAALTFMTTIRLRPYPYSYVVKIIPILLLIVITFFYVGGLARVLVIGALLFSAGGDVALDLTRREKPLLFAVGLLLFLVAHILYIAAFVISGMVLELSALPVLIVLAIVLYAGGLSVYLWPRLGKLRLPVLAYILVLFLMVVMSAFHAPFNGLLVAGALTFAVSDSLIAVHRFGRIVPGRDYWVILTYYVAQLLLVLGFVVEWA